MNPKQLSRRKFIGTTAGFAALTPFSMGNSYSGYSDQSCRLPREVRIASVSQMNLSAETSEAMVQQIFRILDTSLNLKPDIVCLPEVFPTSNVSKRHPAAEIAEISQTVLSRFSSFSKENNCYTVCPVYTSEGGKIYNSAVIIDRAGNNMGEYRKTYLTEGEIESGLTPGPLRPPVFKTDFGVIGVQICFDMLWDEGWKQLREQGAEMVFWPSAYAGGQTVNAKAWQHKYVVVSSTRKNTTKICDITGEVVSRTGIWNPNLVCAPVNLEKAFLHTWPYVRRFPEIQKKYGRKVRITYFDEEEWAIIESLSPDVFVKDILKEFELKTHEQHTHDSEMAQVKARKNA